MVDFLYKQRTCFTSSFDNNNIIDLIQFCLKFSLSLIFLSFVLLELELLSNSSSSLFQLISLSLISLLLSPRSRYYDENESLYLRNFTFIFTVVITIVPTTFASLVIISAPAESLLINCFFLITRRCLIPRQAIRVLSSAKQPSQESF